MKDHLKAILACPRCKGSLVEKTGDAFQCVDSACGLAVEAFATLSGKPVLIDFDASILTKGALVTGGGTPGIERNTGLRERIRSLIIGRNKVAGPNAERMINEMSKASPAPRILIIGSGERGAGSEGFYAAPDIEVVGLDIYSADDVDVVADGHDIPFLAGSFDGVWIQATLQHVLEPEKVVAEIHRILKPAGIVYAETSFMQSVCERGFDFIRYTRSGHRWLFRNFAELDSGNVGGPGQSTVWAMRYLFRGLFRSNQLATLATLLVFPLRLLDRFIPQSFASDAANGVWFLGRRSEAPLSRHAMPDYYPGPQLPR